MENLIFLMSLPRSGSTWLQRLLASNETINTTSESWILLPLFEVLFKGRALTEYNQFVANIAQNEFFDKLQLDKKSFQESIVESYRNLFSQAAGNTGAYYLEKTPRNYLVIDQIIEYFPKSKFIFLWRDPADVALSLSRSYAGKWNTFFRYEIDFKVGLQNLVNGNKKLGAASYSIRYEDIRKSKEESLENLYAYLGIGSDIFEENEIGRNKIIGTYGDKSYLGGSYRGPISKSERNSIIKVLEGIDESIFEYMGYQKDNSIRKVASEKTRFIEPRNIIHPLLQWAYHNQLAASMHRWRGSPTGFPDFGVE